MYPIALTLAAVSSASVAPSPAAKTVAPVNKQQKPAPSTIAGVPAKTLVASVPSVVPGALVRWAPGGIASSKLKPQAAKQIAKRATPPKRTRVAELPVLPVKPSGGYKFGKGDFTPLPPLTLVPRNLPLQPFQPAYKPVLPTQKPALPLAPPPSKGVAKVDVPAPQPVGKLEDHRPLIGVNRPVASIVQELANRENLRVIVGPTEGKTLTIQLGDVDPVDALKRVAQMAGLSCRKHEGVWYVATPDWIAKTFPERHYTQVVQLPTEEAGSLATALQKILSNGTQVEAVGGTHLIVRAALTDLETTASVLAQWPKPEGEKMGLVASVTLDLPEGVEETTVQLVKTGAEEVTVEKLTMGRSWIFRGSPNAVLDGVKRYSALVDRTVFSPAAVARRTEP